ncbi:unnamed protein product [Absidia cylindrospora]
MGSSQSKRTKELSTSSSQRRSVANKATNSPVTALRTNNQQYSIRPKSSFIRTSSSPNTSGYSAKQQQQQQQQQIQKQASSVSVNRPPVFAGVQSNSFFLPKNWQAEMLIMVYIFLSNYSSHRTSYHLLCRNFAKMQPS